MLIHPMVPSKSQIDRLGERLRSGDPSDADLRELDEYRRSFGAASQQVVRVLESLGASPSARPAKSTPSIIEKLRRESIRLSQMQDIAGCRVVVSDASQQTSFVAATCSRFHNFTVADRRIHPSHGYRAVHIIVLDDCAVEVQVRTTLQHLWAQVSELASDVIDPAIKYGGGPDGWRDRLLITSHQITNFERYEASVESAHHAFEKWSCQVENFQRAAREVLAVDPPPGDVEAIRVRLEMVRRQREQHEREQDEAVQGAAQAREALVANMNSMIQTLMDLGRGKP